MAAHRRRTQRYTAEEIAELVASDDEEDQAVLNDVDYEELPSGVLQNLSSDSEEESDDSEPDVENEAFTAPSGRHWTRPAANTANLGRAARQNVMHHRPGFQQGLHPTCEMEAFSVFSSDLLDTIVRYTNLEARRRILQVPWLKTVWKDVDLVEMQAFIGIHILCGVYKAQYRDIKELFRERDGFPALIASMTLQRFECIRKLLRFDDCLRRDRTDPLAPVREIWKNTIQKFQEVYKPGPTLTIDEQLVEYHGRVKFRMYIPTKPGKYGMKIVWLVDNDSTYALNGLVYIGRETFQENEYPNFQLAEKTVLKLLEPYLGSLHGFNVTLDNWFTSCPLLDELLANDVTAVGTVRSNRRDIPPVAKSTNNRTQNSTLYLQNEQLLLLSYMDRKKGKPILVLSSTHKVPSQVNDGKPEIIQFYNSTKSGVDNLDHLVRFYSCKRKTRRWPYSFFMNLLDVICVNSYVLYKSDNNVSSRYSFLKDLAHQLMRQQMIRRLEESSCRRAHNAIRMFICEENCLPSGDGPTTNRDQELRSGRCCLCPRALDKKTSIRCFSCHRFLCLAHRNIVCSHCFS